MSKIFAPALLIAGIKNGAVLAFMSPVMIYKAFAGREYPNFLLWPAILFALMGLWECVFSIRRNGLNGELLIVFLVVGLVGVIFTAVATWCQNQAGGLLGFLAWAPGNGRLRSWIGRTAPTMPAGSGAAKADETLLRGAAIVTAPVLAGLVHSRFAAAELTNAVQFDVVPIPPKSEPEHFLIEGKTGAGKTQAINEMMRKIRQRNQAALIADPAGGYLARFGSDGDTVLNPFDARTVDWSPFAEIEAEYDYRRMALAAIPDGEGGDKNWTTHAQVLFTGVFKALHQRGEHSIKQLLYFMTQAEQTDLADLLEGSPAAGYTKPANARMLESIRSTGCAPLSNWIYLADKGTFSIRKWVRDSDTHQACLFMTYTDAQMAELRNLVACWLELAIVEGLSLTESQSRRLWFIMDELDSLGRIMSLRAGLTKLRKYGGVCVSGLQTIAQLRSTYGHDEAQTLLSCMTTKLILKAGDGETAKYFENEIGQQEVERKETSQGVSRKPGDLGSSSENESTRQSTQAAVMASQITGLENLHGYLMLTGLPTAKVQLAYVPMPDINAPYQAKKRTPA